MVDCEQSLIFPCKVTVRETKAREPRETRASFLGWSQSLFVTITWFAITMDEIRTRRILREKADCKQSKNGCKRTKNRRQTKLRPLSQLNEARWLHQNDVSWLLIKWSQGGPTPYHFIYHFLRKRYPFHVPCLELCIPFNCCQKCVVC